MKILLLFVVVLLATPQISEAKTRNVYGEVVVTDVEANSATHWQRERQEQPVYPIELARGGVQGCSIVSFDISAGGDTENVEVISSVPNKHLGKYTKKIVKKWNWQSVNDEVITSLEKRTFRIDYCLGGESAAATAAQCKAQVLLNCS
ncbi:energy transducer TonB [Shewanella sp. Isolate13]|uniref:energy transducer TonB n=1 Tax=Shewanella sp. Isolate13 TaxID=2908531 RepID=UPI001EFD170B|nr:energy transducer TonB [Shewanella sp. Isolate13]MCG9731828.1 energy transducer TonB [Shewanella sp. Isolate13]